MDRVAQYGLSAGIATLSHPLVYAKTLIQIGYEPLPPVSSKTLLGSKVLHYPNVFRYIAHIKNTDGFFGLYRGFTSRLTCSLVYTIVKDTVYSELSCCKQEGKEPGEQKDKDCCSSTLLRDTARESLARCAGIIASQPFQVIVVRSMCQFVGKETKYSSISSSISEIWQNEGILGFFAGLVPRLVGELLTIWLANLLTHVINQYIFPASSQASKELRPYSSTFSQLVVTQLTYPFNLVSTVMAVNNSGLIAATPPYCPVYAGWFDCWSQLSRQHQLKRGSSMFWRAYKGPSRVARDGSLVAVIEPFF